MCVIISIIKKHHVSLLIFKITQLKVSHASSTQRYSTLTQLLTNETVLEHSISGPATGRINTRTRILKRLITIAFSFRSNG